MLIYAIETFKAAAEQYEQLGEAVGSYASTLDTAGFIFHKGRMEYQDDSQQTHYVGGVLCHPDALQDSLAHTSISELRLQIDSLVCSPPMVQRYDYGIPQEPGYCTHDTWQSVTVCLRNPWLPASPIRCNECGGFVALYRLNLSEAVRSELRGWAMDYEGIYPFWSLSGDYESWAAKELFDVNSGLNQCGLAAAAAMAKETGWDVSYSLETDLDETIDNGGFEVHLRCPKCGGPFRRIDDPPWNAHCPRCRIVTLQPDEEGDGSA